MTCDLSARIERWRVLYDRESKTRFLFTIALPPEEPRPLFWPSLRRERVAWAWNQYQRQCERMAWLDDDSLPYLDMRTGTEIFAEAFGCAVHRPEDNMPFAHPLITSARDVARLRVPELRDTPLMYLFEMADELRERAGEDALVKMVDVQSPLDIAALIWDKNDFYCAFVEEPEAVKALAEMVAQLLTAFLDAWFARYGRAHIAHYPSYYMPDGLTLSEDEVGVVNADIFAEFFLPELERLSLRYGALGMHCCAHARHQWQQFLRIPNLRVLNLVQHPEVIAAAYPFFAASTVQMHTCYYGEGDPWTWPAQLPADARVIIDVPADTPQQARTLAARLREACESAEGNQRETA